MLGWMLLFCFAGAWIGFGFWARRVKKWSVIVSVGGGIIVGCVAFILVGYISIPTGRDIANESNVGQIAQIIHRVAPESPSYPGTVQQQNAFDSEVCAAYKSMQDRMNCCKELGVPNNTCIKYLRSAELAAPTFDTRFDTQWYKGGTLHEEMGPGSIPGANQ